MSPAYLQQQRRLRVLSPLLVGYQRRQDGGTHLCRCIRGQMCDVFYSLWRWRIQGRVIHGRIPLFDGIMMRQIARSFLECAA